MLDVLAAPWLIDVILALVCAEAILITALARYWRVGPGLKGIGFNLLAGACLLLAVRSALAGTAETGVPLWLAAALVAHLADLYTRWKR